MPMQVDKQRAAIAKKLKQMRIERGYTSYEKFANEHGLDRKQYWRIEENQTNMTINTLLGLLTIHEISLEDFFKGL